MVCRLRNVREDDLEMVRHWRMLPDITRHMYTDPDITAQDQRDWHARMAASPHDRVWIIELTEGDIPVGLLSLSDIQPVHRRACWAYYIADQRARGKGLAKMLELGIYAYVFETMGLSRLWCEVLASNDRVVSIHEKFGSRIEGVLRQHIRKGDAVHDVIRMAVLEEDWPRIKEQFAVETLPIEDQD